jgi:hypothetical protein
LSLIHEHPQGALPFAHLWELEPVNDGVPPGCESHLYLRRTDQRIVSLAAGLTRVADGVADVGQIVSATTTALSRIEAAIKSRSVLDDEVRRYRGEELRTEILGPLFLGVIGILDRIAEEAPRIRRFQSQLAGGHDALASDALTWVGDARQVDKTELRNLLARFGIDWFRSERGEPFDPSRHKPVAYEDTVRADRRGRIAHHRRHGYIRRSDNWLIRPEFVVVFKVNP